MKDTAQINAILKLASTLSVHELRQKMRSFASTVPASRLKQAAVGGDPEQGFEQSFASLAHSYIVDKAPGLLDYMVGFQLVDRNEDNTKAVGVFGFNVGNQWMYVPVFFLSGDMKGHELLYLKNQDMFVPLKENWVNYLVNKKPQSLGEGTSDSVSQMGIMQPNIQNMVLPPFTAKFSSSRPWAVKSGLFRDLVKLSRDLTGVQHADAYFGGKSKVASALDLTRLLETDLRSLTAAVHMCQQWPGVKAAMDVHYGEDFLERMVRSHMTKVSACHDDEESKPRILRKVRPGVPVNTYRLRKRGSSILKEAVADDPASPAVDKTELITENTVTMSEEEQQKLLRDSYLIRDTREPDEFTTEYNTQVQMTLSNPDVTGVYDVLVREGEFVKCLVIFAPYAGDRRRRYVTVVKLEENDGKRAWRNIHPSKVFIRQGSTEPDQDGLIDWYNDLPGGDDSLRERGVYVAVTPAGQGTTPFEIATNLDGDAYELYWQDHGSESPAYSHTDGNPIPCCSYGDCYDRPTLIRGKRKGARILLDKQVLYLPDDCKIIRVKDVPKCDKCGKPVNECTCPAGMCSMSYEPDPMIVPGDVKDLQLASKQKTAELKVVDDRCEVVINSERFFKKAGLIHLVMQHGLSEPDAKRLLKEAETLHGVRWRVMYAPGYPLRDKAANLGGAMPNSFPPPSAGGDGFAMGPYMFPEQISGAGFPMQGAAIQEPMEMSMPVPGLEASMTDPNIYNPMMVQDPMAAQTAQMASQTGQKEVFDTAMLSALTKVVHPENMVDKELSNIARTLSTLGRMLFMFYWHNEEFQDRYGKKDLPELEDTLRNAFEMLGDLLLYLKQQSVDSLFGTSLSNVGPNLRDASRN